MLWPPRKYESISVEAIRVSRHAHDQDDHEVCRDNGQIEAADGDDLLTERVHVRFSPQGVRIVNSRV